jgi:two-component system response regulator PilR (NtrC family)
MKQKILLLDDEESLIKWLSYALEQKGYEVFSTTDARRALSKLKDTKFDCMISDIRMPGIDGYEFLRKVRTMTPDTPVIFITAYGSMESAINALRDRANDYILKPFSIEELLLRIRACTSKPSVSAQHIIGESKQLKNIVKLVRKIATTDTTILILGESGTGKELIAREIHNMSKRSHNKFVSISCAALPETLLESELFGYKKGAFTGATTDKDGLFMVADKGTFFLDEIGDAPSSIQMKLLRFLEEKQIVPLGGTRSTKVDVRLVAATNKDLMHEVKKGRFREDLYYRLNVIPVVLPPLRQRQEDIPPLAEYFLKSICKKEGLGEKQFLKTTLDRLTAHDWPGNIRELRHVVERAAVLSEAYYLKPENLGLPEVKHGRLEDLEQAEIQRVLKECDGNISRTAQVLGMGRATLYRKLRRKPKKTTKRKRKS